MEEAKSFLMSRTIIGLIVTAVAFFAKAKGYEIDVEGLTGEVTDLVQNVVGCIGLVLALYGRIKATKKVGVIGAAVCFLLTGCASVTQNITCGEVEKDVKQTTSERTALDGNTATANPNVSLIPK